jgi:hypothetical protein
MSSKTLLLALATSAALLSPAVATQAAAQTACTQLESSAGLSGDDCGTPHHSAARRPPRRPRRRLTPLRPLPGGLRPARFFQTLKN